MTKMAEISLNWYPIYDQNSWKTIAFGAAHTYVAHIREYPPGEEKSYYCVVSVGQLTAARTAGSAAVCKEVRALALTCAKKALVEIKFARKSTLVFWRLPHNPSQNKFSDFRPLL